MKCRQYRHKTDDVIEKIGKYKVLRELGTGATSAVYLALDPFTSREVAVKVVNASALGDKETGRRYRKLFLTEASLVGRLAHPHIATIYDAAEEDDASYIVMEYVAGETLQKYCKVDNCWPWTRLWRPRVPLASLNA